MKNRFFKSECVLVNEMMSNVKQKEVLIFVPVVIDLFEVASYRQSVDEDDTPEDMVLVTLRSGKEHCLNIPFEDFEEAHTKYMNSDFLRNNLSMS